MGAEPEMGGCSVGRRPPGPGWGAVNVVLGAHSWGTQERWRATPAPMPLEMTPPKSCPPRTPRFAPSPFPLFRAFSWWGFAGAQPRWEMRCRTAVPNLRRPLTRAGPAPLGRLTTRWAGAPVRAPAWALDLREAEPTLEVLPALHFRRRGGFGLGTPFAAPDSFLAFLVLFITPPTKMEVPGPQPPSQPGLGTCLRPGPGRMSWAVQRLREKFGVLSAWHLLGDLGQEGLEPSVASVSPAVSGEGADESIRWRSPHPTSRLDTPRAEIPTPGEAAVPFPSGRLLWP